MRIKRLIRTFALWIKRTTDRWVVPHSIHVWIATDKLLEAEIELELQERIWPDDPEITYARTLLTFTAFRAEKEIE